MFRSYLSTFQLFPDPPTPSPSTQLCVYFYPYQDKLCSSNILGPVVFQWSMVNLAVALLLGKIGPPSSRSWQLPVSTPLGIEFHAQLPFPCWNLVWLGFTQLLSMLSQPCCWCRCATTLLCTENTVALCSCHALFHNDAQALGAEDVMYIFHPGLNTVQSHIPVPWPVVVSVNH